jgi:hypothetical protein
MLVLLLLKPNTQRTSGEPQNIRTNQSLGKMEIPITPINDHKTMLTTAEPVVLEKKLEPERMDKIEQDIEKIKGPILAPKSQASTKTWAQVTATAQTNASIIGLNSSI